MSTQYSTVQKLSLAAIVVGSLMCLVGAVAPYWIISDPQGPSGLAGIFTQLAAEVVKGSLGLYMYCVEVLGKEECRFARFTFSEVLDTLTGDREENTFNWLSGSQLAGAACVLLGGLCGLTSLCLACCNCCRRFIVLGILAFIAAACGAASAIIFHKNTEIVTKSFLGFQLTSFGWAFYVFCVGVGILGLASFTACFSAPEDPIGGGRIIGGPNVVQPSTIVVHADQQQQHMYGGPQQQQWGQPPVGMMGHPTDPGVSAVSTKGV